MAVTMAAGGEGLGSKPKCILLGVQGAVVHPYTRVGGRVRAV